jgi:hypothetical protein
MSSQSWSKTRGPLWGMSLGKKPLSDTHHQLARVGTDAGLNPRPSGGQNTFSFLPGWTVADSIPASSVYR